MDKCLVCIVLKDLSAWWRSLAGVFNRLISRHFFKVYYLRIYTAWRKVKFSLGTWCDLYWGMIVNPKERELSDISHSGYYLQFSLVDPALDTAIFLTTGKGVTENLVKHLLWHVCRPMDSIHPNHYRWVETLQAWALLLLTSSRYLEDVFDAGDSLIGGMSAILHAGMKAR